MKTPKTIYKSSYNSYDPDFVEFEYPGTYKNRFVNNRGYIHYKGKLYFLGNPFNGYNIGIHRDKTGKLNVWFGTSLLGHFDEQTGLLVPEINGTFRKRRTRKVLPMS
jgi:hypothetical protein